MAKKKRDLKSLSLDDLRASEIMELAVYDVHCDGMHEFTVCEQTLKIGNDNLAAALYTIDEQSRCIILRHYLLEHSDELISRDYNVSVSTIRRARVHALKQIQTLLGVIE